MIFANRIGSGLLAALGVALLAGGTINSSVGGAATPQTQPATTRPVASRPATTKAATASIPDSNGIMIPMVRKSWSGDKTRPWAVYETAKPIKFTSSTDPQVLKDEDWVGKRGTYSKVLWVHLPYLHTPSLNPANATAVLLPSWWEDWLTIKALNPEARVIYGEESAWIIVDEDGVDHPLSEEWKITPHPVVITCDPNQPSGTKVKIRIKLGVDRPINPGSFTEPPLTAEIPLYSKPLP